MYLSTYFKAGADGRRLAYKRVRISLGYGRCASLHVRKGKTPAETMALNPAGAARLVEKFERWRARRKATGRWERKTPASAARTFYPESFSRIVRAAGYNLQGQRLSKGRTYFTRSAATVRFALLCKHDRELIGTPARMLELSIRARGLLKAANARRIAGATYETCFAQALAELQSAPAEAPQLSQPNIKTAKGEKSNG